MFAGLQYVTGAGIRYGNDAGLRRQRLKPVGEAILRVLPVFRRGFQPLIDYAAVFFLGDQLAKGVFPFRRPMFAAGVGQTVKREAVNAFSFKCRKALSTSA